MLRRFAALVLGPVMLAGIALTATAATAAGDPNASGFVSRANAARQAKGLPAYQVAADLALVARRHAERMAAKNSLYHNPNLGSEVSNWRVVGENVGNGGTVDSIHRAFMDSPMHRANILATDYTEIGVGTVTDSRGVLWVTQVFRLPQTARRATVTVPRPQAPRTTTRARSVAKPAAPKPVAAAPRTPVRVAPVRPGADALLAAINPSDTDALGRLVGFAETMSALAR